MASEAVYASVVCRSIRHILVCPKRAAQLLLSRSLSFSFLSPFISSRDACSHCECPLLALGPSSFWRNILTHFVSFLSGGGRRHNNKERDNISRFAVNAIVGPPTQAVACIIGTRLSVSAFAQAVILVLLSWCCNPGAVADRLKVANHH